MHGWAVGLTHLDICFSKLLLRGNRSDAPSTPLTLLGDLARVIGDDGEDRSCYALWHAHNRLARTQRERARREPWLSAGLAIEVATPTPSPACAPTAPSPSYRHRGGCRVLARVASSAYRLKLATEDNFSEAVNGAVVRLWGSNITHNGIRVIEYSLPLAC